jgi:EAL domain-containing protein (putative c-di-GMP-specific phosphodiesterase class I)
VDDFGTGYSSLSRLQKLPVDELKIDKSFVQHMDKNASDATIVRSTIEMAHNLGLKITAEGVETQKIRDMLKAHGCDLAQGYLMCKPMSSDKLMRCQGITMGAWEGRVSSWKSSKQTELQANASS